MEKNYDSNKYSKLRIRLSLIAIAILSLTSSCQRCKTCEVENDEGYSYEVKYCASGLSAAKELRDFENDLKKTGEKVVCHNN